MGERFETLRRAHADAASHGFPRMNMPTEAVGAMLSDLDAALAQVEQLQRAEEGAKEAFGAVVQQKRDAEAECRRLGDLLRSAHDQIGRLAAAARKEAGRG